MNDETRSVAERYARRTGADRYSVLQPDVMQLLQERQRALLRFFAKQALIVGYPNPAIIINGSGKRYGGIIYVKVYPAGTFFSEPPKTPHFRH